jgi:peroxiredoxin
MRTFIRTLVRALIPPRRRVMLNPGDTAPDFVGRDHAGNIVKLSDFKGKPVVLWFFPKADTPG